MTDLNLSRIYAPKSAAKIAEAAHLIRKAAALLDTHSGPVLALIEAVEGTEAISRGTADALDALATRLDT